MTTTAKPTNLNKCNKAELGAILGVEQPTLDAWIERGAPVAQRGSPGKPWSINCYDFMAWLKAGLPNPDTDPRELTGDARKRWLLSEIERQAINSKRIVHKAHQDKPGALALGFLRVELSAIVSAAHVEHGLPPHVVQHLEQRIEKTVDKYLERIPAREWLLSNGFDLERDDGGTQR